MDKSCWRIRNIGSGTGQWRSSWNLHSRKMFLCWRRLRIGQYRKRMSRAHRLQFDILRPLSAMAQRTRLILSNWQPCQSQPIVNLMHCRSNGSSQGCDLAWSDAGHRSRDAHSSNWFAISVENWGAYATCTLHCFLVVYRVALPPDFFEFLAKLQQIHDRLSRRWLENDGSENVFSLFGGQKGC